MAGKVTKKPEAAAVAASYEPNAREKVALEAHRERCRAQAPSPRLKTKREGKDAFLTIDHPHAATGGELLMAALGTTSDDFANALVLQLIDAGSKASAPSEVSSNFMLAAVKGIGPKDEVEAMLAAQMAAVHLAT